MQLCLKSSEAILLEYVCFFKELFTLVWAVAIIVVVHREHESMNGNKISSLMSPPTISRKTVHVCDQDIKSGCRSEVLQGNCKRNVHWLLLFYAMATVFQFYHCGDMMYEMRRRKSEPTLLPTQGIFNFPHHIGII